MTTQPIEELASHFICPDGDIHPIEDVVHIWVEWSFWRRKWRARLEYWDGKVWNWDRDTREEACRVRDALIADLFVDAPTGAHSPATGESYQP